VNRQQKIDFYGKEYPNIDPVPRVDAIAAKAANLTDFELHTQFSDVFLSLRDFHTNYFFPVPHRCFTALQYMLFTFVDERTWWGGKEEKLVVKSFSQFPEVADLLGPLISQINIGDEMITANGLTIQEIYEKTKFLYGGANIAGAKQSAQESLSIRGGNLYQMPKEDSITFRMKSFNTKKEYTVTLPWIARRTDSCYEIAMAVSQGISNSFAAEEPVNVKFTKPSDAHPLMDDLKSSFKTSGDIEKLGYTTTADTEIRYTIWKPESKNLGVIRLESFSPAIGFNSSLAIIRNLLLNELKDTEALLFDLRDNGGGNVQFAESIPQFFGIDIEPSNRRAIVSKVNERVFLGGFFSETNPWYQAYKEVKPGDYFTPIRKLTPPALANALGMVYLKPVGVLHNGNCYSACDLFSASLKDNVNAKIFGEDVSSGAGGANVVSVNGNLIFANKVDFTLMPFYLELGNTLAQDARIAWRQSIRVKKNDMVLIEDNGIPTEQIVRPTRLDLIPTAEGNSQFDRIADDLKSGGFFSGKSFMYLSVDPANDQYASPGVFKFDIETQGIRRIEVTKDGEVLGELQVDLLQIAKRQNRQISFDPKITDIAVYKFTIKGYDVKNNLVFSTNRFLNGLPPLSNFLTIQAGASLPLQLDESSTYGYQFEKGFPGRKWTKNPDGSIQIVDYDDNVNNQMSYFLYNNGKSLKVSVDADYVTEEGVDFLIFAYRVGKEVKELTRFAGTGKVAEEFEIPATGQIELMVSFFSDELYIEPNSIIKVNKITLTSA
jgi:hypothetical protein